MENKVTKFSRSSWAVLIIFGLIGQIAWSVENMFFNMFVFYDIAPDLDTVTLMVQLSGVAATVVTLIAGTLSGIYLSITFFKSGSPIFHLIYVNPLKSKSIINTAYTTLEKFLKNINTNKINTTSTITSIYILFTPLL